MTVEEINNSFQEYQDDLAVRELHLKLPVTFNDNSLDDLFTLLKEIKETPVFTDTDQTLQGEAPGKRHINTL